QTGRVSMTHNAQVQYVTVDASGRRAGGGYYIDRESKESRTALARVIVLCASAVETVRILLNSTSNSHPDGLGNSSGVLGNYFIDKIGSSVDAVALKRRADATKRIDVLGPYGLYLPRVSDHFRMQITGRRPS